MRITISGPPGSGKTTVAKLLAKKLGYPLISGGEVFRNKAKEMGMDLIEFSHYAESNPEVDYAIDDEIIRLAGRMEDVVIDSRLGGWMLYRKGIPAFKIYINASSEIRARRIQKRDGGKYEKVLEAMIARENSEKKRYGELYDIDFSDLSIYDMVIDSDELSPEEIVLKIMDVMQ